MGTPWRTDRALLRVGTALLESLAMGVSSIGIAHAIYSPVCAHVDCSREHLCALWPVGPLWSRRVLEDAIHVTCERCTHLRIMDGCRSVCTWVSRNQITRQ